MQPLHRLPRIFLQQPLVQGAPVAVSEPQAHYLMHVMRKQAGDLLVVFNADDGEWLANIQPRSKKQADVVPEKQLRAPSASPDIWLVFAPIKHGHMEYMVEKSVELGVSRLLPVVMRHSVVDKINPTRMMAHMVEAAEQSERLDVPVLEAIQPLSRLLASWPANRRLLMADESGHGKALAHAVAEIPPKSPIALLVGPEGGMHDDERQQLYRLPSITPVGLGPRILRADTAAVAAIACLQAMWGDGMLPPNLRNMDGIKA